MDVSRVRRGGGRVASHSRRALPGDFWRIANEKIWTGVPLAGQSKFTFWHVMFFAWFCNMAMHIGMADLSMLRYAKKWQYGFASAFGMFLGHFTAWIASGILCAAALGNVAPGPIAYLGAGVAGCVCVVIAGWTTANPTLYRAGLALQVATPNWNRWKVTLAAGMVTTLAAMFPALVMKLLDFVALYGLVLMPMGAVIFADHWLFPKMGLMQERARVRVSCELARRLRMGVSLAAVFPHAGGDIFQGAPRMVHRGDHLHRLSFAVRVKAHPSRRRRDMKTVLIVLSILGLILTVVPAFLVFAGTIRMDHPLASHDRRNGALVRHRTLLARKKKS